MDFNADLVNDMAQRRSVLFLGAGVSASAKTHAGQRIRQWAEFLTSASAKLNDDTAARLVRQQVKNGEYLFASELLKDKLGGDWPELLRSEFGQMATPSGLHRAIVSLDQRIIITTNFDAMIEDAWSKINAGNPSKTHHPAVVKKVDGRAFRMLRDDKDYIVKLHGDIGEAEDIVFDTSSYHRHAYGNSYYKELLYSLLLTHTFVFIGFSMSDPAISLMVEMFAHRFPDSRPHYIFSPHKMSPDVKNLWRELRKLYVISYRDRDDHIELIEGLKILCKKVRDRRAEIVAMQGLFISPGAP